MKDTRRLPLWRHCIETMESEGLEYGKAWSVEFFEASLSTSRHEGKKFGMQISRIRRELEKRGFYLSGEGYDGEQFKIVPPAENTDVMLSYQREAVRALRRGVVLGTNTPTHILSASERERHESILQRMAVKAALVSRSQTVLRALASKGPALIDTTKGRKKQTT